MEKGKKIFFLSDAHLGVPDPVSSREREMRLVSFLNEIKKEAAGIFFLGDLFDFWFEYRRVVPKGFTRLLGTLSGLSDNGIKLHFFTGNHDIWAFDYLQQEVGMQIYRHPTAFTFGRHHFLLAHGDGMDEEDRTFRLLKRVFTNRTLQRCFSWVQPDSGIWLADKWSRRSRYMHGEEPFKAEKEPCVQFSRRHFLKDGYDYIILGHRHTPVDYPLNEKTRLFILGDWITHFTYAVYDGERVELKT